MRLTYSLDSPEPAAGSSAPSGAFPVSLPHKFGTTEIKAEPKRVVTVGLVDQDALLTPGRRAGRHLRVVRREAGRDLAVAEAALGRPSRLSPADVARPTSLAHIGQPPRCSSGFDCKSQARGTFATTS